ncbi:hypothetical protein AVEN_129494-1, partial [Araneus ventricosus]
SFDQWFKFSVPLTSHFEATRELFWDGPRQLNRGQMARSTPELAPPSPSFRITPAGGLFTPTHDLAFNRPNTQRIFNGIRFRTWSPPEPKPIPCH